jgi:hypothetical protein
MPASTSDRITISYDHRGYRNASALTRADVVLIGDSYVEGDYVSDDQIVSRFLEAHLGRPVANLGVAGYGAAQELVVLERDGLPLAPRVVIWFFFEGNDLYNDHDFENTMLVAPDVRAAGWTRRHGWWRRSLIRNTHAWLRVQLHPLVPSQCPHFGTVTVGPQRGQRMFFAPDGALPWTDFERRRWDRAQHTLREAARVTQERDARLLLVYVPTKFRVFRDLIEVPAGSELRGWTPWPLPDLFLRFCREGGLACVDLTGVLGDAVRDGGMPYPVVDSHWSPEGHRRVARGLAEILESRGWLRREGGGT